MKPLSFQSIIKVLAPFKLYYNSSHIACSSNKDNDEPIDIGFLLDASASLLASGFQKELEFVNTIVDRLAGADSSLRAGVIVYGDTASIRIGLDKFSVADNRDTFRSAVQSLRFDNAAETRIDRGFEEAVRMFQKVRLGTKKVSKTYY